MKPRSYAAGVRGSLVFVVLMVIGFLPKPLAEAGRKESADALKTSKQQVVETYGKQPLSLEANVGQTNSQVKFLSRAVATRCF